MRISLTVEDLRKAQHDWEQVTTCLNGPHVWKCKKCGEWTRNYHVPLPNATLIDPDTGRSYADAPTLCGLPESEQPMNKLYR